MTLRLLKSLRIIRRNTRLANEALAGVALVRGEALPRGRRRASAIFGLVAFSFVAGGQFTLAADELTDPISKLGQRSAPQRWKEARSEWTGPTSRRERRQQIRHGAALDSTFGPDVAAPAFVPAVEPGSTVFEESGARADLMRAITDPGAEEPMYIAPPRATAAVRDVDSLGASLHDAGRTAPDAPDVPVAEPRPFPMNGAQVAATESSRSARIAPDEPEPDTVAAEAPAAATVFDLPAEEPSIETAFLPQIPRTPVAPSPTPAAPPTRVAPPPPPRLPDEGPRFEIPRSDPGREPLMPPLPDEAPRVVGPVELPRLKKITEIAPFQSCGSDGSGVRMCPPNTSGDGSDRCPDQHPLPMFEGERDFIDIEYCWDAPNLFHTPLYFEDCTLERYGHTYCEPFQTLTSAAKFGVQLVGLPYQMALAPVHKREYPLGFYRPGDPAPYKAYQVPLNAEAAIKAAYVYAGLSAITP